MYEEGLRRSTIYFEKLKELRQQNFNFDEISWIFPGMVSSCGGNPMAVHCVVTLPALKLFGTSDQCSEWLEKAEKLQIIGTYAQTELGHGTFIRGLETTATYDPLTKEFIINTPTKTAYKFWPGGLGHTANFAIVMAQLYSLGKCHGIHPFLVQIRDFVSHRPLDGVTIGDIGPKYCFPSSNNGFLAFDQVRIPRNQLMMKNSIVHENGEFELIRNPIMTYANMTKVRVDIVENSSFLIAAAVTIATRYSIVRKQCNLGTEDEVSILDHLTQQMKIFPAISMVFALKKASEDLNAIYAKSLVEIEKGDLIPLAELHALSCGLKAVATAESSRAVESCRLACGGHGYLNSAGLNAILELATASQTYEGDNTVMFLQTGRFLLKSWQQFLNGEKLPITVGYFQDSQNMEFLWEDIEVMNTENSLKMFQLITTRSVALAFKHFEARKKTMTAGEARNETGIELVEIAKLYSETFLFGSMINLVAKAPKKLKLTFENLLEIFYYSLVLKNMGKILQFSCLRSPQVEKAQGQFETSLKKFRKNAIGVVDAFEIHDYMLNSTLGNYNCNVYENLLESAIKSPLNRESVNQSFEKYLQPFMKSNL